VDFLIPAKKFRDDAMQQANTTPSSSFSTLSAQSNLCS